ncbi:hypothetical protein VI08_09425 [Luteibacter yeojuensis]|uniref:ZIP family metal transporter n=1 Tax=Luteibacter yeojuensis TaxID=345309 RepID=A0A0F3KUF4_9GAMM|nr:hypothetical protein VI08_09425 [Luteibacter yeojuensis]
MAIGLLLGDALLHVLPHALEAGNPAESALLAAAFGIVILIAIESALRGLRPSTSGVLPAARMAVVGDLVHHAIDGVILAGAFAAGPAAGYAALLAIAIHEVPREMSGAGALVALGYTPGRAFVLSVGVALAVPATTLLVQALSLSSQSISTVSAFAAGTIMYVALANLLPAAWPLSNGTRRYAPALGAMAGLTFMAWLARIEHHH